MDKVGVYILLCSNNKYYVGSTNNLNRRIFEHKKGFVKSTKNILPIKLVFFQGCNNLIEARRLEYQIKKKKNKIIINRIIKDGYIKFCCFYDTALTGTDMHSIRREFKIWIR